MAISPDTVFLRILPNISTDQLDEFAESFMNKKRNRRISTFSIDGFCMLFGRELVEEIGFFDEKFGQGGYEDEDFCLRALLEGRKNLIAGDVYIHPLFYCEYTTRERHSRTGMDGYPDFWENSRN